jgi:1-deoxy-D-xylulose-5-phosphate synthase
VWEALNDAGVAPPRILRVGLPDRYVTHGKPALLHAEVGFTGKAIAQRIEAAVGQGRDSALAEA